MTFKTKLADAAPSPLPVAGDITAGYTSAELKAAGYYSGTAHTHSAVLVPFSPQSLPATTGTVTIDASTGTHFRGTLTGNPTIANPTGGTDGQKVLVEMAAGGSARTITITAPTINITGVTSPIALASGKRWWGGFILSSGTWYLIGSAVQP